MVCFSAGYHLQMWGESGNLDGIKNDIAMLPIAGSDPTISGYDKWLHELSGIHAGLPDEQKSRWLSTCWSYWFALGLSPRQTIELTRVWYENDKLTKAHYRKYGVGDPLPRTLNWQLKQTAEIERARLLYPDQSTKAYADLTDEQIKTLTDLAVNIRHVGYPLSDYTINRQAHPEKGHITVISVKLDNDFRTEEVRFGPVTGDIWRPEGKENAYQRVYNLWAIVDLCMKWGIDYRSFPIE